MLRTPVGLAVTGIIVGVVIVLRVVGQIMEATGVIGRER